MSQEAAPPPDAPKKKSGSLWLLVTVVVLLVAGGGGAWWMLRGRAASAAPETPAAVPAVVSFDPFVVNLADPGGGRYLRLTLGVVVDGEEHAKEFTENAVLRMRMRSAILEMLAQQTAAQLMTPDGKAALKKAVAERAAESAEHVKISDVLFSEFIVQ